MSSPAPFRLECLVDSAGDGCCGRRKRQRRGRSERGMLKMRRKLTLSASSASFIALEMDVVAGGRDEGAGGANGEC